jgi:hypothetical protein
LNPLNMNCFCDPAKHVSFSTPFVAFIDNELNVCVGP